LFFANIPRLNHRKHLNINTLKDPTITVTANLAAGADPQSWNKMVHKSSLFDRFLLSSLAPSKSQS
jgi:hypothetical protein